MKRAERLLRSVYERKRLGHALYIFSFGVSILVALVFVGYLAHLAVAERDFREIFRLVFTTGVPFFAVGLARRIIGAPRPYEVYSFYEECPKRRFFGKADDSRDGASFPSRHAYSAFVISTALFFVSPWCATALGALAILMCACRVLLGIHFIRDVLAGALIGILAGTLGELLLIF